ncbi:type II toxin-antitoxin system VapC family toxin [Georgenia yuyongxinii]|uniref:Ribonuclease VapC n=1 Tax=Georgenia yuyongxinii TaxID=2589797 RepID=A0A552WT36_9MICO|nr:type II toxin-antitoxin system VapC family toxin [Georgenia yuyongxinii]TRW45982.1 type II toxin-antitoxin system VapC family toxin [Georgenia yuyongxinii]
MNAPLALDTSVAIPLLVQAHSAHQLVTRWWDGRDVALSGHALAETYSVLTRLPGDLRVSPADAARLLRERFGPPLLPRPGTAARLPDVLSRADVAGGAVYDALVALAAAENGATLATRDGRAKGTYEVVGARVIVVG